MTLTNDGFIFLDPEILICFLTPDEAVGLILITYALLGAFINWLNTPDEETQKKMDEEIDKKIDEEIRKAEEEYEKKYLGKK